MNGPLPAAPADGPSAPPPRRRPAAGERRGQILQALAALLEAPGGERITTAALAARLAVSEAALYRHFASKAQMFEGLIGFAEDTVSGLIRQITAAAPADGRQQAARIVAMLLQFGERNPGLSRVLVGDALVLEHPRLQERVNRLFDKVEASLRQCLREAAGARGAAAPSVEAQVQAALLAAFATGRLHRYVRSGFRSRPTEHLDACLQQVLDGA